MGGMKYTGTCQYCYQTFTSYGDTEARWAMERRLEDHERRCSENPNNKERR